MSQAKLFKPLFDRVLIRKIVAAPKTTSGIILPTQASTGFSEGIVIAVGDGYRNSNGNLTPLAVKVDDRVMLPEFGGNKLAFSDGEAVLYRYDELLGIMPKN